LTENIAPTAQTLRADGSDTADRVLKPGSAGAVTRDHFRPLQCKNSGPLAQLPTAHTSPGDDAETPVSALHAPVRLSDQARPSQWSIEYRKVPENDIQCAVQYPPTAQTSLAEMAVTAVSELDWPGLGTAAVVPGDTAGCRT
jgi:hypothetical protein